MMYAEDASYWNTQVDPYKGQSEIMSLLNKFGATNFQVTAGQSEGYAAWLVRFDWRNETYRMVFTPHPCRDTDKMYRGKHSHQEQAIYQMARNAVYMVKAVLNAAQDRPEVLFGFKELPGVGSRPDGLPYTASELDTAQLTSMLSPLALPAGEFVEVIDG